MLEVGSGDPAGAPNLTPAIPGGLRCSVVSRWSTMHDYWWWCKAAFTPAQHVARQQVARTSNMLRTTSNIPAQHVASSNKQYVACIMLPRNMLRWFKRGLMTCRWTCDKEVAGLTPGCIPLSITRITVKRWCPSFTVTSSVDFLALLNYMYNRPTFCNLLKFATTHWVSVTQNNRDSHK